MSVNVQSRIDVCTLASIARVYEERGMRLTTKSELVARAIEHLAVIMEKSGCERFEDIESAYDFLRSRGLDVGSSRRCAKELWKDRVREVGDTDCSGEDLLTPPMSMRSTSRQRSAHTTSFRKSMREQDDAEMAKRLRAIAEQSIDSVRRKIDADRKPIGGEPRDQAAIDRALKEQQDAAIKMMAATQTKGGGSSDD